MTKMSYVHRKGEVLLMKQFGGDWTKTKIEILVEYAQAYLTIMRKRRKYKTLYFDGFAGSGSIVKDNKVNISVTIGAARRIVEIEHPMPFHEYYFVEKDPKTLDLLRENTKSAFPQKTIHAVCDDCNKKLLDLANFLRNPVNGDYRTLAYVDPCGMQVEWRSIECLRGLSIDLWILVPTGMGVNRLLETNGNISPSWVERLEKFLGLTADEIKAYFYRKVDTLFPEIQLVEKEKNAIERSAKLYKKRLEDVFEFVSKPFELRNSTGSPMYHLFLASNNATAVKIANDIVKKFNR